MQTREIIRRKRDRETLSSEELNILARGIADGSVSEGQGAAFAMAVYFNNMSTEETVAWTHAMRDSGNILEWPRERFDGPILDKHSTGGVGDKVSLVLAPMLAACGAIVPMISGRGLGHTGGTLDKLEAIPGLVTNLNIPDFESVVERAGCAIVDASEKVAPADRVLYGIRDVTATVDSIPLITASILSKKMAAGLEALVLDIKTGSGAFASSLDMARQLASSLVDVSTASGLPVRAVITDMNQVLGTTAGNALEVIESLDYLVTGQGDKRFDEVVMELGIEALMLGDLADDRTMAQRLLRQTLSSGEAAERFAKMVRAQGGPANLLETYNRCLPRANVIAPVDSTASGYVRRIDVRKVGLAVVTMGGGRKFPGENVNPAVGLSDIVGIGRIIKSGDPVATVHAGNEGDLEAASREILGAIDIGDSSTPPAIIYSESTSTTISDNCRLWTLTS
jgi:thymidine phosphorylase